MPPYHIRLLEEGDIFNFAEQWRIEFSQDTKFWRVSSSLITIHLYLHEEGGDDTNDTR